MTLSEGRYSEKKNNIFKKEKENCRKCLLIKNKKHSNIK